MVSFTLAMWCNIAESATYYVAKNGSDSNSGTEVAPFLTITKAVSLIQAGDTVLVKTGTYEESIPEITVSGTANAPITFKTYGDGEVIIQAPKRILTSGWTLTSGQTYTYEISDTNTVYGVIQVPANSGTKGSGTLNQVASIAAVEASANSWYYDSVADKLYVRTVTSANPNTLTLYAFYNNFVFRFYGTSYIIVDGFTVRYAVVSIWFPQAIRGNIVRNCKMSFNSNNSCAMSDNSTLVEGSIINNIAYRVYGGISPTAISGVKVLHNTVYDSQNFGGYADGTGGYTVKNNIFYGRGLYIPFTGNSSVFNYNLMRDSFEEGNFSVFWKGTWYSGVNPDTKFASFKSDTGQEANGLGPVDPKFISTTFGSEDFDLQTTSPCIGRGDDGLNLGVYFRPSSPTGLSGKVGGTSKKPTITISWNSVIRSSNKITGYKIYRSNNPDTGYTLIGTVAGETTTTYTDQSPLTGNSYYKVTAYKDDGANIINIESWYSNSVKVYMSSPRTTVPAGQGTEVSAFFDDKTKIIISANTLTKDLTFSIDKVTSLPSTVDTAKVVNGIEFKVEDTKGNEVKELEGLVTIVIHTTSTDGIYVDETDPKINKEEAGNKLIIGYWSGLLWLPLTNTSKAWTSGNDVYVSAQTNHFSTYGIMVKGTSKVGVGVRVYPNPFTPASSDSRFNKVTFYFENNDNEPVEIKIWDITGVLVRRLEGPPGVITIEWDGRNEYGDIVEGGVYIWQLKVGNSMAGRGTLVVAK